MKWITSTAFIFALVVPQVPVFAQNSAAQCLFTLIGRASIPGVVLRTESNRLILFSGQTKDQKAHQALISYAAGQESHDPVSEVVWSGNVYLEQDLGESSAILQSHSNEKYLGQPKVTSGTAGLFLEDAPRQFEIPQGSNLYPQEGAQRNSLSEATREFFTGLLLVAQVGQQDPSSIATDTELMFLARKAELYFKSFLTAKKDRLRAGDKTRIGKARSFFQRILRDGSGSKLTRTDWAEAHQVLRAVYEIAEGAPHPVSWAEVQITRQNPTSR